MRFFFFFFIFRESYLFRRESFSFAARLIILLRSYFLCRDSCGPPYILFSKKQRTKIRQFHSGATLSSLNISRCTYCSGYDDHTCDFVLLMLETEESISKIDSHRVLQDASVL